MKEEIVELLTQLSAIQQEVQQLEVKNKDTLAREPLGKADVTLNDVVNWLKEALLRVPDSQE